MNLILLFSDDFDSQDTVWLRGRRFEHWRDVLRQQIGDSCQVGLLNGEIGIGVAEFVTADAVQLRLSWRRPSPPPLPIELIIALPRPKTLKKVLHIAVSSGVKSLRFINAWKVEKSYWKTPSLEVNALANEAYLALEQAVDTRMPQISLHPLFKPFVEDELPTLLSGKDAFLAHPGEFQLAPVGIQRPTVLFLGPEGGFTDYEVQAIRSAGATPVRLGERILRTEVALAALLGRVL